MTDSLDSHIHVMKVLLEPHRNALKLSVLVDLANFIVSRYGPVSHSPEILAQYVRHIGHEKMEAVEVPRRFHGMFDYMEEARLSDLS